MKKLSLSSQLCYCELEPFRKGELLHWFADARRIVPWAPNLKTLRFIAHWSLLLDVQKDVLNYRDSETPLSIIRGSLLYMMLRPSSRSGTGHVCQNPG
jgi:hypothetical protein